jgi:hypothetical protein
MGRAYGSAKCFEKNIPYFQCGMEKYPPTYLGTTNPKTFMKQLFLFIAVNLFIGCNEPIVYPSGGYDYPKEVKGDDTNFYYLPIKNIESKRDAFRHSFFHLAYNAFKEQNLSLKPLDRDKIRLTFDDFTGVYIITLEEGLLIAKKTSTQNKGQFYIADSTKSMLSEIEKMHLKFLDDWYSLDTVDISPYRKLNIDSAIKRFPELLNLDYYIGLRNRIILPSPTPFLYDSVKRYLSNEEFYSIFTEINESGYWSLPFEFETSPDAGTVMAVFTLKPTLKQNIK